MTRSDATDHHPPPRGAPSRWPLPPLLAITTALAAVLVVLALAGPAERGSTDPAGPAPHAGRLAPAQAQRARAQATADRFARTFARSLRRPRTTSQLRAAGVSQELARRIAAEPSWPTSANAHARSRIEDVGTARAVDVTVRAERGGWLATATLLLAQPGERVAGAQRLSLTFRLEHDAAAPGRLVVIDANPGGQE